MVKNKYLFVKEDYCVNVNAKDLKIEPKLSWYMLVSTCFFLGRFPIMPGTIGSLLAYPLYSLAMLHATTHEEVVLFLYAMFAFLATLGWLAVSLFQKETKAYDHSTIVIDEVVGQLLTLAICHQWLLYLGLKTLGWHHLSLENFTFIVSFLLFRCYDIHKPFFIGFIDSLSRYAWAVLLDDILAAIFSGGTVYVIYTCTKQFL